MKLKSYKVILCLISIVSILFAFSGCKNKPKEVYVESSDFESYPDYYNSFQADHSSKTEEDNSAQESVSSDNIESEPQASTDESALNDSSDIAPSEEESSESEASEDNEQSEDESSSQESKEEIKSTGVDLGFMGPLIPVN